MKLVAKLGIFVIEGMRVPAIYIGGDLYKAILDKDRMERELEFLRVIGYKIEKEEENHESE